MLRILGSYNLLLVRGIVRLVYRKIDSVLFNEQDVAFMREGIKRRKVMKHYAGKR